MSEDSRLYTEVQEHVLASSEIQVVQCFMDWYFTSKHLVPVQFRIKGIVECKGITYSPWLYLCHRSPTQPAAKL